MKLACQINTCKDLKIDKIKLNCELLLYTNNTVHLFNSCITSNVINCAKNAVKEIETKVKVPKL